MKQRLMWILWPAFLMAGVLEFLVFGLVDPEDLRWMGGGPIDLPRNGVYTLAFFIFWLIIAIASLVSQILACPPGDET